jgi:hypothetical protein
MGGWQTLILDGLVIAAVTVLAALHVMPGEAAVAMLGAIAGARAMARGNGGGGDPPAAGGGASKVTGLIAGSTVGMLCLGIMKWTHR